MESTAGNAQGHKMYNHFAMGDGELASFVGERMQRADVPVLSVYGRAHFMPTQVTHSAKHSGGTKHSQLMYDR